MSKGPSFESCAYLGDTSLPPLMPRFIHHPPRPSSRFIRRRLHPAADASADQRRLACERFRPDPRRCRNTGPSLPRSPQISRPRWRTADPVSSEQRSRVRNGRGSRGHAVRRTTLRAHTGHSFMNRSIKHRGVNIHRSKARQRACAHTPPRQTLPSGSCACARATSS